MWWPNFRRKGPYGLVIDWRFHRRSGWVSAFAPALVTAFVERYRPLIITSPLEYRLHRHKLRYILAMEPGWAAPKLHYHPHHHRLVAIMASDPHNKTDWFQEYALHHPRTVVLSQYYHPFFYHFPAFPPERLVHFPWAVADQYLRQPPPGVRSNQVAIFGGRASDAYDVRNWCRQQPGVTDYDLSGVENKRYSDAEFFDWLAGQDAVIAAGSSLPRYDLVTPKYFEIPAAGALLFGQYCRDLQRLGFTPDNAVLFHRDDFTAKLAAYRQQPAAFQEIRRRGHQLVRQRHCLSHRLAQLEQLFRRADGR